MKKFIILLLCSITHIAQAGPISSGGVPETEFQRDSAAIRAIFDYSAATSLLQYKGRLISITPVDRQASIYLIATQKCDLHVQYVRTCSQSPGELPQCNSSVEVLRDRSTGDCF